MRCLVTGAGGFIGRALSDYLSARDYAVTTIGRLDLPGRHVRIAKLDPDSFARALGGETFDAVVHLAAAGVNPGDRNEAELMRVNADLPEKLAKAASEAGIGLFISAGSCAEYAAAPPDSLLDETSPLETNKLYGRSKAEGGLRLLAAADTFKLGAIVLRLFNVYGSGEASHRLLPSLLSACPAPVRLSPGTQIRDFVHISDVCAAFDAVLRPASGRTVANGAYNVCTGVGRSVADFARITYSNLGAPLDKLEFGAVPMRPDEIAYLVGDPARLASETGWQPRLTLEAGLSIETDGCLVKGP